MLCVCVIVLMGDEGRRKSGMLERNRDMPIRGQMVGVVLGKQLKRGWANTTWNFSLIEGAK